MRDELKVVRCNLCNQPTVRGETCRQCGKTLTGLELPYIAQIASAQTSRNLRDFIKPMAIGYGVAAVIWMFGFGKISSLLMVGITVFFAIKYLREL